MEKSPTKNKNVLCRAAFSMELMSSWILGTDSKLAVCDVCCPESFAPEPVNSLGGATPCADRTRGSRVQKVNSTTGLRARATFHSLTFCRRTCIDVSV
ncbi:hypothetical protein EVAR_92415_1 [Eumeta japonica]|uniref:Uncharacterized protein n=1 Tax=Eumeta variegata TaxID=151549 RepID=A0A4C1T5S5_EUMVA|nr:hypothetical protein EVAR_92415_1 [Eumeta japonica]